MLQTRIIFFGTPVESLLVLEKLYSEGFPIVAVVTKPARPVGRKQILTPTAVALWAEKNRIPILTPASDKLKPWFFENDVKVTQELLNLGADLLVSADYTQKIPLQIVKQTHFGGINVHPSLLPAYRGPAPVPWAIFYGEKETGVSLVTLAEKLDAGIVIAQEKETILSTDTTETLLPCLFKKGAELLVKTLPQYLSSFPNFKFQISNFKLVTPSYFGRLTREDGFEPWEKIKQAMTTGEEAGRIERKLRAFTPWPGLWTEISETSHKKQETRKKRLKILKGHLDPKPLTLNPNLVLDDVQVEGKKPISFEDFKRSFTEQTT